MDPDRLRATAEKVIKQFHANIHLLIVDEANSEAQFLERFRDLLEAMREQKPEIGGYLLQPPNFKHYGHLLYRKFANLEASSSEFETALADTSWRSKPVTAAPNSQPAASSKEKEAQAAKALADARASAKPAVGATPGKLRNLAKQFDQGQVKNASSSVQVDTSADEALARGISDAWKRRDSDVASDLLVAKLNSENLNFLEARRLEQESEGLNEALASKLLAEEQASIERARVADIQAAALAKKLQAEEEARARAQVSNRQSAEQQGLAAAMRLMEQAEAEERAARRSEEEQDAYALRLQLEEEQRIRHEARKRREIDERDAALAAQLAKTEQNALVLTRNQSVEHDALIAAEIVRNEERARRLSRTQADLRNAQLAAQLLKKEEEEERANAARRLAYKQQGDQDAYRSYLRATISANSIDRDGLMKLADLRRQFAISEDMHFLMLAELGVTRDQFTQMIKNGQKPLASSSSASFSSPSALPAYEPPLRSQPSRDTWTTLTQLRVRAAPSPTADEVCQLNAGKTIMGVQQGHWLQHDLGWSMIQSDPSKGDVKYFLRREPAFSPPLARGVSKEVRTSLYEVLMPLRVRERPSATSPEVLVLEIGSKVNCLEIAGIWLRHDLGWSMIHSDPSKGAIKYFLQPVSGGDGRVG